MEEQLIKVLEKPFGELSADEFQSIKHAAIHFPDGLGGSRWGMIIERASEEIKAREGAQKAISIIDEAYNEFDRVYPNMFDEKSKLLKKTCLMCLEINDFDGAHQKMKDYLYNALAQVHFCSVNEKMPYYSFRGFTPYALDDIKNETISLAHPREFNDPLDTILVYWLNTEIKKDYKDPKLLKYRLLMKKVAEHIKIRCLIAGKNDDGTDVPVEDLNVLMWSHYADSHKGFCVRYEFSSDMFDKSKIPQKNKLLLVDKIHYSDIIKVAEEPSIRKALLEKSDFWDYEDEMRLISFDCSGADIDFPVINCAGAVTAVYLGAKCSDANRRKMEKAIGDKNIPLYQMSVDENKLTRFKKTLIG